MAKTKRIPGLITALKTARSLVARKNGWIQGQYSNGRGGYCAVGAIESAIRRNKLKIHPTNATRFVTKRDLVTYNDELGRTQKEVVGLFDRAITRAQKLAAK